MSTYKAGMDKPGTDLLAGSASAPSLSKPAMHARAESEAVALNPQTSE